jgi:hypothetical protein
MIGAAGKRSRNLLMAGAALPPGSAQSVNSASKVPSSRAGAHARALAQPGCETVAQHQVLERVIFQEQHS